MQKKSLIAGAFILTAANLITRFIGFFYRIYMSQTIGAEGMGLYQLIMPIYALAWSITSSGFTTTISKLTAQENAKNEFGNMGRILRHSVFLCMSISIVLSLSLFYGANFISCEVLNDARTILSLKILALCFPFMSAGSCIRGYFFGLQYSTIPALSQIFEQIIRIATVFSLSSIFVPMGLDFACAAAVTGIVIGEILSFVFVLISYQGFKKRNFLNKKSTISRSKTFFTVLSMALPLTASRVTGSLLSTAENILIPQQLQLYGHSATNAMSTYGSLTGMAMPLIQLPSALLTAVSITLVPAISEASAVNNKKRINYTVSCAFLFTAVIGIGTAGIFAFFPHEICMTVYKDWDLGNLLFKLALLSPFFYMHITISGLLNGLGKHVYIFGNHIISSIISIAFIYFLMPLYGTDAFIWGWFASLVVTVTHSMKTVIKEAKIKTNMTNWIFKPIIAVIASGIAARQILIYLPKNPLYYILSMFIMLLIYIVLIFATGSVTIYDILLLKNKK